MQRRLGHRAPRLLVSGITAALLLLCSPLSQARITVKSFDGRHASTHTRLVFETDAPPRYDYDHQDQVAEPTLVLYLKDTKLAARIPRRTTKSSQLIRGLERKVIKQGNGIEDVRFTFKLAPKTTVKISTLPPAGAYRHRLLVDFSHAKPSNHQRPRTAIRYSSKNPAVVAIDAGHGGADPGATAHGLLEKDITLAIANYVVDALDQFPDIKGHLIRSQDVSVSLRKRVRLARALFADFFVSIHADAFKDPEASGVSVYTKSDQASTSSEAGAWLASRVNRDIVDLPTHSQVTGVLAGLTAEATRTASLDYGTAVLNALGRTTTRLRSNRVEQGDFTVLTAPDIPSILIETGFITNPREAEMLASDRHRRQLATHIAQALATHIHDQQSASGHSAPPPRVASTEVYRVALGDTLNEIAKTFNLLPSSLARYNNIHNEDDLKVGDVLLIP